MNIQFYRNRFEDLKISHKRIKHDIILTSVIIYPITIAIIIISLILAIKNEHDTMKIMIYMGIVFTFSVINVVVFFRLLNKRNNWVKNNLTPFIIDIVNKENNENFVNINNKSLNQQMIKATSIIASYDNIQVLSANKFLTKNGKQGYFFKVICIRSSDNSSVEVLNGEIIIIKTPVDAYYQIRNDRFRMAKGTKNKEFSTHDFTYYYNKKTNINPQRVSADEVRKFVALIDIYLPLNEYNIKRTNICVNYGKDEIAIYGSCKNKLKYPKELTDEYIYTLYEEMCLVSKRIEKITNLYL